MPLTAEDRAVLGAWRDLLDAHQVQEAAPEGREATEAVYGLVLRAEGAFKDSLVALARASRPGLPFSAQGADRQRVADAHARIAALPEDQQRLAAIRASRSYSVPDTCVRFDGCRREGDEVVWPDGERWPARTRPEPSDRARGISRGPA